MKIDGNHGGPDCVPVRLEPLGAGRARAKAGADQAGGDKLELSTGVELLNSALRVASEAPEIRQDAVERARRKLEAGELGQDLSRLADRMIEQMLAPR